MITRNLTLRQVFISVLAAIFGVQRDKYAERDMTQGTFGIFLLCGIATVFCLMLLLVGLAYLVS